MTLSPSPLTQGYGASGDVLTQGYGVTVPPTGPAPPSTLSAQGQLLAGLYATLSNGLAGQVAATDGIRVMWPREDLVQRVASGDLSCFPLVVIGLGDEKPAPSSTATAFGTANNRQGPTVNGVATVLYETARWQCPLTLTIVAAGERGPDVADGLRGAIKATLRRSPGARVLIDSATGGTFTLSVNGKTTGAVAYNATASAVQSALGAASISATVAGSAGGPYSVMPTSSAAGGVVTGSGANLTFDPTTGGRFAVTQLGTTAQGATPSYTVQLPDDLETATVVPGPQYGLTARLVDSGASLDFKEANRDLYRVILRFTAYYSEYRPQTISIATGVTLRDTIGVGIPITLTPSS